MEDYRLDTIESYTSAVKAARRALKEHKKKQRRELDMYRLRAGKTTYCFNTYQKLKSKLKELDTIEYETAKPGEALPDKKIKL